VPGGRLTTICAHKRCETTPSPCPAPSPLCAERLGAGQGFFLWTVASDGAGGLQWSTEQRMVRATRRGASTMA
jgi:hypothetical protein